MQTNCGGNCYVASSLQDLYYCLILSQEEAGKDSIKIEELTGDDLSFLSALNNSGWVYGSHLLVPNWPVQVVREEGASRKEGERFIGIWDTPYANRHDIHWGDTEPVHCAISGAGEIVYLTPDEFSQIISKDWVVADSLASD